MIYKAFISYSHAADGKLAPAIQSALQSFAKPWYRLRTFRVFRDKTTLAMTPQLWPSIQAALDESEFFLLLASVESRRSIWVEREIEYWPVMCMRPIPGVLPNVRHVIVVDHLRVLNAGDPRGGDHQVAFWFVGLVPDNHVFSISAACAAAPIT